jgi:hypothetical protein
MSSKFPDMIMTAPPPDWNPVALQPAFMQPLPQPFGAQPYYEEPSVPDPSKPSQDYKLMNS